MPAARAQPGAGPTSGSGAGSATVIQLSPGDAAPEVSAAAAPSEVRLGDRFTVFVTAVYDAGVAVNLREPVELGGAFEVRRRTSSDRVRPDGRHVREWQIEAYAWALGDLQVPPIPVTFTIGGRAGQVATRPVPVRVDGVLGNTDDPKLLRPDLPPVALEAHGWLWNLLVGHPFGLAIACALLVAAYLAARRRGRRRRRVQALVGDLAVPPLAAIDMTSERALEALLAIDRSGVLARDRDRKRGYAELSEVIRRYLGARYRVVTADLTSAELLAALARVAPGDEHALVAAWLERCDLVKYGGLRATARDAAAVLADARSLIIATTARAATGEAA